MKITLFTSVLLAASASAIDLGVQQGVACAKEIEAAN